MSANLLFLYGPSAAGKTKLQRSAQWNWLWDDLCRRSDEISSPLWHNEVLAERELKMLSGESAIEDWETAKVKIRELIS